jgi:Leucine-rich repeat (LRR) protein
MLLFSCKVKLPHEAVNSKLSSMQIGQVALEDLVYFKNLETIELADNSLRLEWLAGLENLREIDLQYNKIELV